MEGSFSPGEENFRFDGFGIRWIATERKILLYDNSSFLSAMSKIESIIFEMIYIFSENFAILDSMDRCNCRKDIVLRKFFFPFDESGTE